MTRVLNFLLKLRLVSATTSVDRLCRSFGAPTCAGGVSLAHAKRRVEPRRQQKQKQKNVQTRRSLVQNGDCKRRVCHLSDDYRVVGFRVSRLRKTRSSTRRVPPLVMWPPAAVAAAAAAAAAAAVVVVATAATAATRLKARASPRTLDAPRRLRT